MARKKQELAIVEEEPVTAVMEAPDFLEEGGAGAEEIGQEDMQLPWLKLLQGTTPGLQDNGWQAGNLLHTILEKQVRTNPGRNDKGHEIPAELFQVTPVICLPKQHTLFRDVDDGGGILARQDGKVWVPSNTKFEVKINKATKSVVWDTKGSIAESGLTNWGTYDPDDGNSRPAADLQYRYICVSPTHPEFGPFMIQLQRSAIGAAKHLNALIKQCKYDAFAQVFNVTTVWSDEGPNNKKFLWKFSRAGLVPTKEAYEQNKAVYEMFKDVDVTLHDEESGVEDQNTGKSASSGNRDEPDEY